MSTGAILLILGCFYFAAQALTVVFQKTRIPDVLILLIIGIGLGPLSGIASPEDFGRMGSVMTVIALTVILFESGISLKLSSLATSLGSTVTISFVTAIVTVGIIATATVGFFNGDWSLALLTGTILCGTSSAVIIPMVQSLKMSEKPATVLILESALTDVICIVLTFALVESMEAGSVDVAAISRQVAASLGIAVAIGILGGLFWLKIWDKVRQLPTTIFTTIAFAFVLYGISELLNVSGAIATLAFGITLANMPALVTKAKLPSISEPEKGFYREMVFLLKIFFFIYLGVSAHVSHLSIVLISVAAVVVIYFFRLWITRFFLDREGSTIRDASIVSVMAPKGLAAAVLASLVAQKGISGAETIQSVVFSVVVFSIFLTAVLIPLLEVSWLRRLYGSALGRFQNAQEISQPVTEMNDGGEIVGS